MKSTEAAADQIETPSTSPGSAPPFQGMLSSTEKANPTFVYAAAICYLLIPSLIVLIFFSKWPVPVLIAGTLASFWWLRRGSTPRWSDFSSLFRAWPYLIISALIVWLSGIIPPFAENVDWYKHYAILNELETQSWPPLVVTNNGDLATLRYSLSYYVIPAIIAKFAGSSALYFSTFAWTTLGCFLALVLAFGGERRTKARHFLLGGLFFLFSGADIVGSYVSNNLPTARMPFLHFEWWASFGQLSSSYTSLTWTPQHAISGWISAFLIFRFPGRSMRNAGVLGAAVSLWSPFSAIGIVPTLIWAAMKVGIRPLMSQSNIFVAPILLLSAASYLTHGTAGIPFRFVWDAPDVFSGEREFSAFIWASFIALEFGAISAAILLATSRRASLLAVHVIFLVLLCIPSVGTYNDLLMRGSIPALGIIAMLAADAVVNTAKFARKAPLIALILIGVVTPAGEVMRALVANRMPDRRSITISNVVSENKKLEPQYLVYDPVMIAKPNVINGTSLTFETFGEATFDTETRSVSSRELVDAAMVSDEIELPAGIYKLDAIADWDVASQSPAGHAAHISLHAAKILVPIKTSRSINGHLTSYFVSPPNPFKISFGLGGWAHGKGHLELKLLSISLVKELE